MNKHASQPRAITMSLRCKSGNILALRHACPADSLSHQSTKIHDTHAYELFSAYCSLVYVTPIPVAFLADKVLGNRMAVMLGALLMAIGHVVLGASEIHPSFLYLSLAIIVCGMVCLNPTSVACSASCMSQPIRVVMAASR